MKMTLQHAITVARRVLAKEARGETVQVTREEASEAYEVLARFHLVTEGNSITVEIEIEL